MLIVKILLYYFCQTSISVSGSTNVINVLKNIMLILNKKKINRIIKPV